MESATDRRLDAARQEAPAGERAGASVPVSYAERAMNSLMSLHSSLVAEKERTLDLTRRLMEERQGRAELESYVRLLEAEVARLGGPDLREDHDDRADALARASTRILDALRQGPRAPVAEPAAAPVAAPVAAAPAVAPAAAATPAGAAPSSTAPAAAAPLPKTPAAARPSAPRPVPPPRPGTKARAAEPSPARASTAATRPAPHRVPRPPRPSRRYRTKITSPAAPVAAEARTSADAAPQAAGDREDDGWRQW